MTDTTGGVYSEQHPWELTSQTLEVQRRQDANYLPAWMPPVPVQPDPANMIPPRYGYSTEEPTLSDVVSGQYTRIMRSHIIDTMMTDWSGERGSYEASERPHVNYLSGL
jgi:hypothetical protein